jgi:hypothetical protein
MTSVRADDRGQRSGGTPHERKDTPPMKQSPGRDTNPEPGTRPPEYVIETWVSKQLRDRIQRTGRSLGEVLRAQETRARETDRSPLADMEAEP